MAPKRNAREPTPSSTATQSSTTAAGSVPAPSKASSKSSSKQTPQEIAIGIWHNYLDTTPQRTKLIDVFMAFLVVVGALQFIYCIIVGNFVCCFFKKSLLLVLIIIAFQCVSIWLFSHGGTVRLNWCVPNPDWCKRAHTNAVQLLCGCRPMWRTRRNSSLRLLRGKPRP
jgi:hypothetical protein